MGEAGPGLSSLEWIAVIPGGACVSSGSVWRQACAVRTSREASRWMLEGEVGQADLDPGTGYADGAHHDTHPVLLTSKDVLDGGTHRRTPRIGAGDAPWHRTAMRLSLVCVAGEHALCEDGLVLLRAVCRVGSDAGGPIILADQKRQPCAVMDIGCASVLGADQATGPVNADVVLVAEDRDGEVDRLERLGFGAVFQPWLWST